MKNFKAFPTLVLASLIIAGVFSGCAKNAGETVTTESAATAAPTTTAATTTTTAIAVTTQPATTEKVTQAVNFYQNTQYGFTFNLPDSWTGYSIVTDKWEGTALTGSASGTVTQTGPIITIRHPLWTSANPRQDIPIMVFTPAQWASVQKAQISVSAAPMAPSELGRSAKYVFALPARYNISGLTGYREVETILSGNPLKPF